MESPRTLPAFCPEWNFTRLLRIDTTPNSRDPERLLAALRPYEFVCHE